MTMIAQNLKIVEEKIAFKCHSAARERSDIKLIAVSKTKPVELLIEAFNSGVKNFGENKAQEFSGKSETIKENFIWHFIGHLQTNKVKYVVKAAEYIHSVDSQKLAEEINNRSEKIAKAQKILLEVNTSKEASKYGVETESEVINILDFCLNQKNIIPAGLMTMAPYTDDEKIIRDCFRKLFNLRESINKKGYCLKELSMGMTNDYEIAVEEGATMLRVGTAIFGSR